MTRKKICIFNNVSRHKEISNIEIITLVMFAIYFTAINSDSIQTDDKQEINYNVYEDSIKTVNTKIKTVDFTSDKDFNYDLYGVPNHFSDKTTERQSGDPVDQTSDKSADHEYVDNIKFYPNFDGYSNKKHLIEAASVSGKSKIKLSNRIIQTRYGKLQGIVYPMDEHRFLRPVEVFMGVPYATPPIGTNRFSPTRTPSPWDGIRLSDRMGPVCPQKLPNITDESAALERMPKGRLEYLKRLLPYLKNQSEDCLYMNIYAPLQLDEIKESLPVVVYVHGESFEWNSGNAYDGSVLASYADLIVVTFNYRLGLFGFLNANPSPHSKPRVANYGLMDQIAALHWLQQNIAQFGGDPTNITMIGHGSGAACVNFLLMSPTVMPGLFHRAILMSGSALSSWALVEDPVGYSIKLAQQMNCTIPEDLTKDHENIVDCMREIPMEELLNANIAAPSYLSSFGPSVDGVVIKSDYTKEFLSNIYNDVQGFMPIGDKINHISNHKKRSDVLSLRRLQNKYDIIFGVVTSEALWKFSAQDIQNGFEGEKRDRILRTYVRNAYTYHLSEIFYTVVNEYTDWDRTVQHPINMRDATIAALSDAQYIAPLIQSGDILSSVKSPNQNVNNEDSLSKTFFYVFDYQTKDGDYPQRMGSVHGEELPYLFGAPLVDGFTHFPRNYTKSELALSESFMLYVANFARRGNPNDHFRQEVVLSASRERNRFRSLLWDEYDSVHQKYLEIGMKPRMKNHFRAHQLSVWLRLIPELHRAGIEDVIARHNLFRNHNDPQLYEGVVRPDPLSRITPYETSTDLFKRNQAITNNTLFIDPSITTVDSIITRCVTVIPSGREGTVISTNSNVNDTISNLEAVGYAAYSTALSVTIAIGCSLLILNVLIFAGVYYQRDKALNRSKSGHSHKFNQNFDPLSSKHTHYQMNSDANPNVILDIENQRHSHSHKKDPNFSNIKFKGPVLCDKASVQINSGALIKIPPSKPGLKNEFMTLPPKHSNKTRHKLDDQTSTLPRNISQQYLKEMQGNQVGLMPPNGSALRASGILQSPIGLRVSDSPFIMADTQTISRRNFSTSSLSINTPQAAMNELGL